MPCMSFPYMFTYCMCTHGIHQACITYIYIYIDLYVCMHIYRCKYRQSDCTGPWPHQRLFPPRVPELAQVPEPYLDEDSICVSYLPACMEVSFTQLPNIMSSALANTYVPTLLAHRVVNAGFSFLPFFGQQCKFMLASKLLRKLFQQSCSHCM